MDMQTERAGSLNGKKPGSKVSETEKMRRALKKREAFCRRVYMGEPISVVKVKMVQRINGRKRPVKKTIHVCMA